MKKETPENTNQAAEFDFTSIRTFEDACARTGDNPGAMPDPYTIPEQYRVPMLAYLKLLIIFAAINNGWKPDWSNYTQSKYYPYFSALSPGLDSPGSYCSYGHFITTVGSRLCTFSREAALHIGRYFQAEYADFFLYKE